MSSLDPQALLRWTVAGEQTTDRAVALDAFSRFLLLHLATRETLRVIEGADPVRTLWALAFGAAFAASLYPPFLRVAILGALPVVVWKWAWIFPGSSNHFLLEVVCLVALGLRDTRAADDPDGETVLAALRWLPVLVFFWSGLNKLIYGTYFNGAFLASWMPNRSFALVFGLFMPDAELQRVLATEPPGPFELQSLPALAVSNAVWFGEIAAAPLLLIPRLRMLGLLAGLLLMVGIEAGAREFLFGFLMLNIMALYLPPRWSPRLLFTSAGVYALLVATRAVLAPDWWFN